MFQTLSQRINQAFDKLCRRGVLTEGDVLEALREVRIALLEADVALPVVKEFIEGLKVKAIGQEVLKSVTPGQMVIKIVHDELVELLGAETPELNLATTPPAVILMVGLQGAGKTTASAKIALYLKEKKRKKVLLASLDIYRPAAQEQLEILGKQISVETLPIHPKELPVDITKRALDVGRRGGYDVVILDTAGRLHLNQELMTEVLAIKKVAKPIETLLTVDAMTGQDAVVTGKAFHEQIGLTGLFLSRIDGDTRGGAALSMRFITGCPIKFVGIGEKVDQLEVFHPERIASRILDQGDIITLVEKAQESADEMEDAKLQKRLEKGLFHLGDFATQIRRMQKMGGLQSLLGMLPGMGGLKEKINSSGGVNDKAIGHQLALIQSMTPKERKYPKLLNGSRKKRVALGAGLDVPAVNRLLKQFEQMSKMMKQMNKMGKKGMMRGGMNQFLGGPPRH